MWKFNEFRAFSLLENIYFTKALKFYLKRSVVGYKTNDRGVWMKPSYTTLKGNNIFVRELDCWRGLVFGDKYPCEVEALTDASVRLRLDLVEFSVSSEVARELSECLNDALAIQFNDPAQFEPIGHQSIFKAVRLIGYRGEQYEATGEIAVTGASLCFSKDSDQGTVSISVCTILGGGYEIVIGDTGFSFAAQDAIWLRDTLLSSSETVVNT